MSARWELFTEDHVAFRDSVRQFIQKEIAPNVGEWERAHDFPRDLYLRFGELGLLGLKYEERYGGTGPDLIGDRERRARPVRSRRRRCGYRRA